MKQTVDVDDLKRPRGSTNHRRTTPSGRVDALARNLIVVHRAVFTMATVQRSCSSFSSCTSRSRAGKLEVAQHHNRKVTMREEEKNGEKDFLVLFWAFYNRHRSH
jgi:hypothetical protein